MFIDDWVLVRFIKNKVIKLLNGKYNGKILFIIWVGKIYFGWNRWMRIWFIRDNVIILFWNLFIKIYVYLYFKGYIFEWDVIK